MALSAATLSTELQALTPIGSEPTAIARLSSAFDAYFREATVGGVPLVPATIAPGLAALQAALVGMSLTSAGAPQLAAAVTAFWTAQLALSTSMWITAPVTLVPPTITPPAGLVYLSAALSSVFASNVAGGLSLGACCDAIAGAIHTACSGATVLGSVPPASPAPLVIT
jgi:hypothetical protein